MLKYLRKSILDSRAQTVVNTVNTVGVMGKGLASEYKKRYPVMFERYKDLCSNNRLGIGNLYLWRGDNQWVLNFPTKKHWRNPSRIEYIESGLKKFVDSYREMGVYEIAFPRLGCGNGGLDWEDVRPMMEHYLRHLPITIYIHDFDAKLGQPEHIQLLTSSLPKSFPDFVANVWEVFDETRGSLTTLSNRSRFDIYPDFGPDGLSFIIDRSGRKSRIHEDDLFQIWSSILSGPVSVENLTGVGRTEGYYLFAILARLPYFRLVETKSMNSGARISLELDSEYVQDNFEHFSGSDSEKEEVEGQIGFEWH